MHHIHSEQLIQIKPKCSNYSVTLNAHNRYFCRYYPGALMVFQGSLDLQRFTSALEQALHYFPFLCGQLSDDGKNLRIVFDEHTGSVICEYAFRPDLSYTKIHESTAQHLPQHVPSQFLSMPEDVNGLLMLQLRVTQCADGFALGYRFNHACLDQSSLLYFLKYVIEFYHPSLSSHSLKHPVLLDTFNLLPKKTASSLDFDAVAQSIGRIKKNEVSPLPVVASQNIQIIFNHEQLRAYGQSLPTVCSTNDLVNAFLLKLYALQEDSDLTCDSISIEMAANCRNRVGLGDETIGNIVATIAVPKVSVQFVRESSLAVLAQMIRQQVQAYSSENFLTILNWYQYAELHELGEDYVAEYLFNPSILMTTNWLGFDYRAIHFDDHPVLAILQAPQTFYRLFLGVITFDHRSDHQVVLNCQIPRSLWSKTQLLCQEYAHDFFVFSE
jgi:hypothetical protein